MAETAESKKILCTEVCKSYPFPDGSGKLVILDALSFEVREGESIAITGVSGSGKSTLLNLLGALDKPDSGKIIVDGTDLGKLSDQESARYRNRNTGFIFQLHHLLPQCTVWENVLIPTVPFPNHDNSSVTRRALSLLEKTGLSKRSGFLPGRLSGGELQRTAIVRALINEPGLILADEPTGSLDNRTAGEIMDIIANLNKDFNTTVILVTHSMELAARMRTQYELHEGVLKKVRG